MHASSPAEILKFRVILDNLLEEHAVIRHHTESGRSLNVPKSKKAPRPGSEAFLAKEVVRRLKMILAASCKLNGSPGHSG